jgi:hypothetical protein
MKNLKKILFVGILGLCTTTVWSNTSEPEKQNTYKRSGGSNRMMKEYKIHSDHDADTKRVYNTSNKKVKTVEANPEIVAQSTSKKRTNSVRSISIEKKHHVVTDENTNNVSPFRATKHRR